MALKNLAKDCNGPALTYTKFNLVRLNQCRVAEECLVGLPSMIEYGQFQSWFYFKVNIVSN